LTHFEKSVEWKGEKVGIFEMSSISKIQRKVFAFHA
jgi:hypothetical protein